MQPLVSCVCLTTHPKRAAFLPDALRSYRAQQYPSKELILINDGAPLASRAEDIHVVNLPDRGRRYTIGEKRNAGIRCSNGEFIATWDDDDMSMPHRLTEQIEMALGVGADYVLADRMHVADETMKVMGACQRALKPVMPSALIRKSIMVDVGGYSALDYLEDYNILERIKLLRRGFVASIPNSDFYVMRRHGNNVTLRFGEQNDEYAMCAMRGPYEARAQQAIDRMRLNDGDQGIYEM